MRACRASRAAWASGSSARRSSCTAPTSRRRTSCLASSTAPTATARGSPSPTPVPTSPGLKTRGIVDGDEVVITGQKVWTSGAQMANMMFCLCRTDPDAPKHRGISYVLVPMKRPDGASNGFELRPIRQITGTSGFTETFITGARAPLFNVIGGLHNGWRVTMTTLGNERGGNATTQHVQYEKQFWRLVDEVRTTRIETTTRSCGRSSRGRTRAPRSCGTPGCARCRRSSRGRSPGPGASINKMFWSEYARDLGEWVMNLRGAQSMVRPRRRALRARPLAVGVPDEPVGHDLGRHRAGAAQHRRRARARACRRETGRWSSELAICARGGSRSSPGAGRGIGRGHALELARQGAKVVVNDLGGSVDGSGADKGPAQAVVDEIVAAGGEAVANTDDVADWDGAKQPRRHRDRTFGTLDVVVNNAGILRDRMLFNMDEAEWDAVIRVHLKGTFSPSRWAAEYWRARHKAGAPVDARIINTSSTSGLFANPGQSNYGAAKSGIATFSIIAAKELGSLRRHGERDRARRADADDREPRRRPMPHRAPRASGTRARPTTSRRSSRGSRARSRPRSRARCSSWVAAGSRSRKAGSAGPGVDHGARWDPGRARCGRAGARRRSRRDAGTEGLRRTRSDMAIDRFPVEAGHILMFARSIGDPNPVYADADVRGARPRSAASSRRRRSCRRARSSTTRIRCGRRSGSRGSARARTRPAVTRAIRRAVAGGSGGGGGGGAAPGCTPSSTTRTTGRCAPAMCSPRETRPGERWEKEGKRAGKLVFSETITEYRDEQGELVVTARGVGVRTEKVVGAEWR